MRFSKKQIQAKNLIQELTKKFGKDRWFVQEELKGITLHTLKALVAKDYLDKIIYSEHIYYRVRQS